MATWQKHFKIANLNNVSPISGGNNDSMNSFGVKNYQSSLPEVYVGHPNRIERYNQYEQMDADSEINAALDILAEFSTQTNIENGTAFDIDFKETPTDNEIKIVKEQLQQWCKLNEFDKRIFKLFRNTLKYGDQVFIRDPETFKLLWSEMSKVTKVIVNESDGKKPEQYVIKDLNPNLQNLTVTAVTTSDSYENHPQMGGTGGSAGAYTPAGGQGGSRFTSAKNEAVCYAEHVVHISLSEGLDMAWPFGTSVLETVFKVFKQKELLEDAIIIYRIQRAPERRIFKIDVGNMPSHLAMAFVERVKNEVHQRRIPSINGSGGNMMDATYNPISMNEDFFFPQTADGRGSSVEALPGGCLVMDTKVPLLDGRTLTLSELTEEYASGKTNWVYSCNPDNGHIVPGIISWAGVTQKSAQVMKIILDNGQEIIATPDHKFPVIGKGFVEAKDLQLGESMIPFNTKQEHISNYKKLNYTQVYQPDTKQWQFVHRLVANELSKHGIIDKFTYDESRATDHVNVIHHVDLKRHNNSPENLVHMVWDDHKMYHQSLGFSKESQRLGTVAAKAKFDEMKKNPILWAKYTKQISDRLSNNWKSLTDTERNSRIINITNGIQRYFDNITDDKHFELCERNAKKSKLGSAALQKKLCDNEFHLRFTTAQKTGWENFKKTRQYVERNEKIGVKSSNFMNTPGVREKYYKNQEVIFDKVVLDKIQSMLLGKTSHQENLQSIVNRLNSDQSFLNYYLDANKDTKSPNWDKTGITESQIRIGVTRHGYKNWRQFRKEAELYNHKIVSIEYLPDLVEVGTLTIDAGEKYHDYHTFALESGIFTKNSNLGEITDLRFFTNKLFRGLRIPASYLPTQNDEAANNFSDGKVGIAMIQEWRFNQYCKRLQNFVSGVLDKEFKIFLRFRGFNIDNSVFDLKFNEPQNFTKYRQVEIDAARISTFTQVEQIPYLAKRFLLTRYLGLTEEEMQENEQMWSEEHADENAKPDDPNLRAVGVSAGGISSDLENLGPMPDDMGSEEGEDMGGADMGGGAGATGATSPMGSAGGAPAPAQ